MTILPRRPVILLLGDSLTEQGFGMQGRVGWAGLLAAAYSRRADVVQRGYFGYNTNHIVQHVLPSVLQNDIMRNHQGDLLFATVFVGANDAVLAGNAQHVPLETYQQNLATIVTRIRHASQQPDLPVFLMTPPPLDAEAWCRFKGMDVSNRTNERHRQYGQALQNVAKDNAHCHVYDTWQALEGDATDFGRYLTDGLHLSEAGNRQLYDGFMKLLEVKCPAIVPESIPLEGKPWEELCE